MHSVEEAQTRPFGLVVLQVPSALQYRPLTQSPSPVQEARQSVPAPLHLRLLGQVEVLGVEHAPAPLHVAAAVKVVPLQLFEPQVVADVGNVHAEVDAELHAPPQVVPLPVQSPRVPCGCPDVTGLQMPSVAGRSHASHLPLQAVLQQ